MIYFLYAIYSGDVCLYVGITDDPKRRMRQHRAGKVHGISDARMRVLRTLQLCQAHRVESQVIDAFQRRGEARLNSPMGRRPKSEDDKLKNRSIPFTKSDWEKIKKKAYPLSAAKWMREKLLEIGEGGVIL